VLNGLFDGDAIETSYDKYSTKGFHHFNNEWTHLEEKMNLPKVVETYDDLPKSFIKNGICATNTLLRKELPPSDSIETETYFKLHLDTTIDYNTIKASIYNALGLPSNYEGRVEYGCDWTDEDNNLWGGFYFSTYDENESSIAFSEPGIPIDSTWDKYQTYVYINNDNTTIDIGPDYETREDVIWTFETAGWYSYLRYDNGKSYFIKEYPVKVDNFIGYPFKDRWIRVDGEVMYWLPTEDNPDPPTQYLSTFTCAGLGFVIGDNYEEYPQGFYKFDGKAWNYDSALNGTQFNNAALLNQITEEDLGDIVLNTEVRHSHENKQIIDQITEDHLTKLNKPLQLAEGLIYENGYSANKYTYPVGDGAWIEGNAAQIMTVDESMQSAYLNVVTSTSSKSTTTTATFDIIFTTEELAQRVYKAVSQPSNGFASHYSYAGVIFMDEPNKFYYIKFAEIGHTISGTSVSLKFTLVDGKEKFPITGNFTRDIDIMFLVPNTGEASHSEGWDTIALSPYSHAEGYGTRTTMWGGSARGHYNEVDYTVGYLDIVGNGTSENNRSNAYTLDRQGNAWFAGNISTEVGIQAPSIFLTSPNGVLF
jgi:hypothetical protein